MEIKLVDYRSGAAGIAAVTGRDRGVFFGGIFAQGSKK